MMEKTKETAKYQKAERNEVLAELKKDFPVRHLQRVTGISGGVITKA